MISLVLESSTYHGSVALLEGATLIGERAVAMRGREHEALMAAVGELLADAGVLPGALGRVICGSGPGSFTSLRISASIAKGLCMAGGAQLIPISSLRLLVESRVPRAGGQFVVAVDAMRGESYVQGFSADASGASIEATQLMLLPTADLERVASDRGARLLGPQRSVSELLIPLASAAQHITNLIDASPAADLGQWEPAYGRLAEAQVKWEATQGRALGSA